MNPRLSTSAYVEPPGVVPVFGKVSYGEAKLSATEGDGGDPPWGLLFGYKTVGKLVEERIAIEADTREEGTETLEVNKNPLTSWEKRTEVRGWSELREKKDWFLVS